MIVSSYLISTGLSLLLLAAIFIPLERAFPAKKQPIIRHEWWTDLAFFLGQYFLWSGLVFSVLASFQSWLHRIVPAGFRASVASQPWWLQVLEVVLLSDLLIYWGHRLQHRYSFLWRFHSIHHSAEHLDWLAAHREHPIDSIYTIGLINLPAFALGFPLETLAGFMAFRGIWAIYIHSNVRLPTGPLRVLFGAPELHHWHHDCARDAGNYANISPLMDILFGTYHCPDHEPERLGIGEASPQTYLAYMIQPLLPRSRRSSTQLETDRPPSDPSKNGPLNLQRDNHNDDLLDDTDFEERRLLQLLPAD